MVNATEIITDKYMFFFDCYVYLILLLIKIAPIAEAKFCFDAQSKENN
tara:strand:- start:528 stop:671 length:144 start_codon:yes stop_codon:yes gene_type:complete